MERITYRKTLDVHKSGVQFLLQGFQTADNLSRVVEISLMASGDAIDFPLDRVEAMMYVITPNATEPSINKCTIKDNKVVYDVLPIVVEGITTMQLKIIETSPEGAKSVIASPSFSVEVTKSDVDDGKAEQKTTFTALEDAVAKAKATYDERFLRMELTNDCIFKAYYADGTVYETDLLKKLFYNGNVQLSESYAHGGTGVRAGEDTDNSMYYSNVSKSEALNSKNAKEDADKVLEEVRKHGMYTVFSVDFETGEVEYVSPSFKFLVNKETGELDAIGQSYSFETEVYRVVEDWLARNGVNLQNLEDISTEHTEQIAEINNSLVARQEEIGELQSSVDYHDGMIGEMSNNLKELDIVPEHRGGTGMTSFLGALNNSGTLTYELVEYTGDGDESLTITFDKIIPQIVIFGASNFPVYRGQTRFISSFGANTQGQFTGDEAGISWGEDSITLSTLSNRGTCGSLNYDGYTYTCFGIGLPKVTDEE